MIGITGGTGFIGSNLVHGLNEQGRDDILVVDNLEHGRKFLNIRDARISDYLDQDEFLDWLVENGNNGVDAVFHLGACSDTTEWDGRYMMNNNYLYSKEALDICLAYGIPFIYASSAAVYGAGKDFTVRIGNEQPLNVYGYSKALFDQYVARKLPDAQSQIVGLRYFNVYGPREQHKGGMASVAYHHYSQVLEDGVARLFEGCDGYEHGDQKRDFVYVKDTIKVKQWMLKNPTVSGIFNVGTGRASSFNDLANSVISGLGRGRVEYIPFPEHLKGSYQSFTQADISGLREAGYHSDFLDVSNGVTEYMKWLQSKNISEVG
jgi:ADP-L-glycero-D-manno-heptose 6-epimerase